MNTVVQPRGADPRARFVDFDDPDWDEFPPFAEWTDDRLRLLDYHLSLVDQLPPIGEWHDEHWLQAMAITRNEWLV